MAVVLKPQRNYTFMNFTSVPTLYSWAGEEGFREKREEERWTEGGVREDNGCCAGPQDDVPDFIIPIPQGCRRGCQGRGAKIRPICPPPPTPALSCALIVEPGTGPIGSTWGQVGVLPLSHFSASPLPQC